MLTVWLMLYGKLSAALTTGIMLFAGAAWYLLTRKAGHDHGSGFMSIDAHAQRSRLGGISPGVKLVLTVVPVIICISFRSIALPVLLFACMTCVTVFMGKTPFLYYIRLLKVPALFILAGAIAILIQVGGVPQGVMQLRLGGFFLCVTDTSREQAFFVILKALGSISCLYMLSLSTPMGVIIGALRRTRVPAVMIELMYLIYRYIFVLLETQTNMQNAAASRLGYNGVRTSVSTALNTSMNLLFLSFRRSSDCFAAMESRCYDGEIRFLEKKPGTRPGEILSALSFCMILILVGIVTGG